MTMRFALVPLMSTTRSLEHFALCVLDMTRLVPESERHSPVLGHPGGTARLCKCRERSSWTCLLPPHAGDHNASEAITVELSTKKSVRSDLDGGETVMTVVGPCVVVDVEQTDDPKLEKRQ